MKEVPENEIDEMAIKHKVDASDILWIIKEWENYYNIFLDSFKEFKELPFPKRDELPWSIVPVDWAKLSLFYYKNLQKIKLLDPKIFNKVVLTSLNPLKIPDLELSGYIINQIVKVYLEKMASDNLLFGQQKAEEILDYNEKIGKKLGKREDFEVVKQNELIKIAAKYLRSKNKPYTPIICDLFFRLGFRPVKPGNMRKIINKP